MTFKPKSVAASTTNIVNGTAVEAGVANVPHDQAYDNADQLASVFNADRSTVIRGGGTIGWTHATETLVYSASINISFPNENIAAGVGGATEQVITAGSVLFTGSKQIAAIKVSRTASPAYTAADIITYANMTALEGVIAAESPASETARFDYIILATREPAPIAGADDNICLWDGRRIRDGESVTNGGATDTQYTQQADFTAKSIDENQDRNTYLLGGGILTWDGPTNGLKCSADLTIFMPNNVLLQLPAGTFAPITNGECYVVTLGGVVTLDRTDGAVGPISVAMKTLAHADVDKTNDDLLVVAVCRDSRLHLMEGTVLEDGFKMRLGGLATGVRWIFTGPGTGIAAYDFSAIVGSIIRPTGATPEFYAGGTELMLFVNGLRVNEGRYCLGIAGIGDYDEPVVTTTPQTAITWTPTATHPIPTSADIITAFVGLANPNIGPTGLDNLTLADSVGVTVATVDLSTEEIREDDATVPTVVWTAIGAGAEISVGPVLNDPVTGLRAQGKPPTHGAIRVFGNLPQIYFDDTDPTNDFMYLGPGDLPLPDGATRTQFHVGRIWTPQQFTGNLASPPASPGGLVYVYIVSSALTHDNPLTSAEVLRSTTAPQLAVSTYEHWLAHPSNTDHVYVGCYWAYTNVGPTFDYVRPFDRAGDQVIYRSGHQPSVLSDATGWAAAGGTILAVALGTYVPTTAHAVILQAQLTMDMTAYCAAGGGAISGVAFYGDESTVPGAFPSDITDPHDVQYLVQPNKAATVAATEVHSWAPFILPVNDLAGGSAPGPPTVDVYVGPYTDQIDLHVVGYVESQQRSYRHR